MWYYLVIFEDDCVNEQALWRSQNLLRLVEYAFHTKRPFQLASHHFDSPEEYEELK